MSRWWRSADDFPSHMNTLLRRIRNLKMLWLALIAGEPGPVVLTAARGHVRPMPEQMKRLTLRHYARRHGLRTFVETGTFRGETIEFLLPEKTQAYLQANASGNQAGDRPAAIKRPDRYRVLAQACLTQPIHPLVLRPRTSRFCSAPPQPTSTATRNFNVFHPGSVWPGSMKLWPLSPLLKA